MTPRFDLRKLRYFSAVAEELNFRKAAERLHITQPPLTRQIKELETALGVTLFDRSRQGVRLTSAGEWLARETPQLIVRLDELGKGMQRFAHAAPARIRLGLTTAVEAGMFESFQERLHRRWRRLELVTVNRTSPKLVADLWKNRLDAALIVLPTHAEGLQVITLSSEPAIVALSDAHALSRRRVIGLRDLKDERLFWFERYRNPKYFDYCRAVFRKFGFVPKTIPEPHDHHVLLAMVAEGRGIAFLAQSFVKIRRPGVRFRPLLEGKELRLGLGLVLSQTLPAEIADALVKDAKLSFPARRNSATN